MRHLTAIAALAFTSGCSLLFNPDRVLGCDELPNVAPLEVVAGDGLSLTWQWPNAPADAGRLRDWELCWGDSEETTDTCRRIAYGTCDSGTCSFRLDGADAGLEYNKRVWGQVVARDYCGSVTPAAKASATPINGSFLDVEGITVSSGCDAGVHVATPGELVFEMGQPGLACLATAMMGDERWLDGTLDLEFRLVGSAVGGFGVRAPVGATNNSPRNGVIFTAGANQQASVFVTRRDSAGSDLVVATAIPNLREAQWNHARVAMSGPWMSISYGPTRETTREVIRWRDPTITLASGQLGLALFSAFFQSGRIDVRNLRVRTGASIPDGGPTSERWAFGIDSLNTVRRVGNALLGSCPALPGACATCAPDAGAQCFEVTGNAQGTVEVPIGLDYERPWRVRFRYAADSNGVATNPQVLRTTVAASSDGFGGFAIIDSAGLNWAGPLRMFREDAETLGALTPGEWNTFEVLFDGAGGYSTVRNGSPTRSGAVPGLGPHLGALVLGGGGAHAWFADLEISQEP